MNGQNQERRTDNEGTVERFGTSESEKVRNQRQCKVRVKFRWEKFTGRSGIGK